jgi:dienelactone hydrolase
MRCSKGQRTIRQTAWFLSLLVSIGFALMPAAFGQAPEKPAPGITGPYKVVMETDPLLPDHVIYRPDDVGAVKDKMPVVAFGNGSCNNAGNSFANYLAEVASYGFVAVANGLIDPVYKWTMGGEVRASPERRTSTSQLFETMEWAKAQNSDKASRYYGKLNLQALAVMGQSCGGMQALEAAGDPRVKAVVVLNSGIRRSTGSDSPGRGPLPGTVESLAKLHTPVIYIVGDETDMAYKNAEADFREIKHVPVFKASLKGAGHGGTVSEPHGGKFGDVITRWLLWQLKQDSKAGAWFEGENCGLCGDAAWVVQRKQ